MDDPSAAAKREAWATRDKTETYTQDMGSYALARDARILRFLLGTRPGRLLDMPCGTGRHLGMEKELGFEITAADYSPSMLSVARHHSDIPFVRADVFHPPFAERTFHVILISRLLFHYRHPEGILSVLLPCLKDGGRLVFDTLNAFSLRWCASWMLRPFRRDTARRLYFQTPASMARKLRRLGLCVSQQEGAYLFPTRFYRYLPAPLVRLADGLEKIVPSALRVLTFWEVRPACPPAEGETLGTKPDGWRG